MLTPYGLLPPIRVGLGGDFQQQNINKHVKKKIDIKTLNTITFYILLSGEVCLVHLGIPGSLFFGEAFPYLAQHILQRPVTFSILQLKFTFRALRFLAIFPTNYLVRLARV